MALQVPPEELDPLTRIQWARDKVRQYDPLQPGAIKHRRKLPEQPMIRTQTRDPQSDGPSVGDGKDGVGCVDPVLGQVRKDLIDRSASQFGRERVRRRTTGGEPLSLLPQACDAESLGVHEVLDNFGDTPRTFDGSRIGLGRRQLLHPSEDSVASDPHRLHKHVGFVQRPRLRTRPGRTPVNPPSDTTGTPLTKTCLIPSE